MVAEEKGEDRLQAVSFAAAAAAFMACLERAVMVSVFVHWRVWAFIALNLLLLAILFTSKSETLISQSKKGGNNSELKRSKKRRQCSQEDVPATSCVEVAPPPPLEGGECAEEEVKSGEIEKAEDYDELSEEELKKRVEDFIAMFRQHLVCDAKGRIGNKKFVGCGNAIASRVH